ncbi:hypothetical protein AXF42_Ash005634 [Apostasia shenzhenica]|uniref:Ribonuclease H1 N-terminal domain-containing protein n=1 Tax=Apostasia shenzhenica TaxID=1088818 RepID=A0A2I0BBZ8_9ASPA|nr:hypothetical protein AXF42_Ash005634 [Apostasia shenzhenica]
MHRNSNHQPRGLVELPNIGHEITATTLPIIGYDNLNVSAICAPPSLGTLSFYLSFSWDPLLPTSTVAKQGRDVFEPISSSLFFLRCFAGCRRSASRFLLPSSSFAASPAAADLSTWMSLYLVLKGRQEGIFTSWAECHAMVNKYPGALYFKVKTVEEAKQKMEDYARLTTASSHIASQCNGQQVKNKGKQVISVEKSSTPSGKFGAEVTIAVLAGFLAGIRHQKLLDRERNN